MLDREETMSALNDLSNLNGMRGEAATIISTALLFEIRDLLIKDTCVNSQDTKPTIQDIPVAKKVVKKKSKRK